jgi:hypothetical protein
MYLLLCSYSRVVDPDCTDTPALDNSIDFDLEMLGHVI